MDHLPLTYLVPGNGCHDRSIDWPRGSIESRAASDEGEKLLGLCAGTISNNDESAILRPIYRIGLVV
ncbi:unnamed protein product [Penicillium roqueforti FM164]|uniref:Genomic scaffold, ProqFM164S03 n=1 Tax=Penicillium roqueforti (strain FM164) TaxID=1365484 RepID=W6QA35_PENRF|nr:unnamed protein product [Penicillium roqueforti FM164]